MSYIYGIELSSDELRSNIFYGQDIKEILSDFISLGLYKYGIDTFILGGVIDERNFDAIMDSLCNKISVMDIENNHKMIYNNSYMTRLKYELTVIKDLYPYLKTKRENRYILPQNGGRFNRDEFL